MDLRKDLITVPSCDAHNAQKTTDDEFLLICLAGNVQNNVIGYVQTKTKVARALSRKRKDFMNEVIRNAEQLVIKSDDGTEFPVYKGAPNHQRLWDCFEHIAYGLYFHTQGSVFKGECRTLIGFLHYHEDYLNKVNELTLARFEEETKNVPWIGANQAVFKYKFAPVDDHGLVSMRMIFYGGTDVFTVFIPPDTNLPGDFAMALAKAGIETRFHVGDKVIVFNENGKQDN